MLTESKRLFDEHDKLINAITAKMNVALNDVREHKTLNLSDNMAHNVKYIESINTLVSHYDTEAKMVDIIANKDTKINLVKEESMMVKTELVEKEY